MSSMQIRPQPSEDNRASQAEAEEKQQEERESNQAHELQENYTKEFLAHLKHDLAKLGYLPPEPSPFLTKRTLSAIARQINALSVDQNVRTAIAQLEHEVDEQFSRSGDFLEELKALLVPSGDVISRVRAFIGRTDRIIDRASVSIEMPSVDPSLERQMLGIEHFLAQEWVAERGRGILAIHVDYETLQTILQIGIAEHGPIYITVPRILRPDDLAQNSIMELLKRIGPFRGGVDPMAVIDGAYPGLNFNELFIRSRVIRAPSGDTSRLVANIEKTAARSRLSPANTVVLNSAPATVEEYLRVFAADRKAQHWAAWGDEQGLWDAAAARSGFAPATEASRLTLLDALTQAENVVVIVAHCDGKTLFLPQPAPNGTVVSTEYLLEHRDQIAANSPFVYLFSCEAGNLSNLQNFASTLLDCGAAGVVASQTVLGAAEGRQFLSRLLSERRGQPPIEDCWRAMREEEFFEMEVFLA
jgi:hypothetical protein